MHPSFFSPLVNSMRETTRTVLAPGGTVEFRPSPPIWYAPGVALRDNGDCFDPDMVLYAYLIES